MARMLTQLEADCQTIEEIEMEKCMEILDNICKTDIYLLK